MVIRILLLLLLSVSSLYAQERKIVFRVSWVDAANDSTKIEVLLDNDSIPFTSKFSKHSPDTIALPQPPDNILYKFRLISYRGGRTSAPSAPVVFPFNADKYYKLHRWIASANVGSQCNMFMFNDSSFTMRDTEFADTLCTRYFTKIPPKYRAAGGARARIVNKICTLQDNGRNNCSTSYILSLWDTNVGPDCRDLLLGQMECTLLTTVMDYDSLFANRYTAEAVCSGIPLYDILTGNGCVPSGWVYPTGLFPGRWETARNFVIFKP